MNVLLDIALAILASALFMHSFKNARAALRTLDRYPDARFRILGQLIIVILALIVSVLAVASSWWISAVILLATVTVETKLAVAFVRRDISLRRGVR